MQKQLHLVAFDVPWPANYGGVIDIFYKLKALHAAGILVHLHCFQYGRPKVEALEALCATVHYYPRRSVVASMFGLDPYIVASRKNKALLKNLAADPHPVLFEGLHTCAFLNHKSLNGKAKAVRLHNVEWQYYKALAKATPSLWKYLFYRVEAVRLHRFERMLKYARQLFTISAADNEYYQSRYSHTHWVMPFHGHGHVQSKTGLGTYALYHGNLGVAENEEAALWLMLHMPRAVLLVVAGHNPSEKLKKAAEKYPLIRLVANPGEEEMTRLVQEAQIHLLPTFQATGIKLKLIRALFEGRFVAVNPDMLAGSGLEDVCEVFYTPETLVQLLKQRMQTPFTETDLAHRTTALGRLSDTLTLRQLTELVFESGV